MKIVAANLADTLRHSSASDSDTLTVIDTVREELRGLYGEASDDLPVEMAALVQRLDGDALSARGTA